MPSTIPPASPDAILPTLLAALPSSAISTVPPPSLLPLLSPILRQRVQIFSSTSQEPWLPLLSYDSSQVSRLTTLVRDDRLQPHPSSGEIEIDWDNDVKVGYRRLDIETLQALLDLTELSLRVRLVWCINDADGQPDGWRVGEVNVLDAQARPTTAELAPSVSEAETRFKNEIEKKTNGLHSPTTAAHAANGQGAGVGADQQEEEDDDDDDDDYWAQYDNTPARTPAAKRSPAPTSMQSSYTYNSSGYNGGDAEVHDQAAEDAYFSQYAQVQPAMDNHDPDEEAANGPVESTLGANEAGQNGFGQQTSSGEEPDIQALLQRARAQEQEEEYAHLEHPRPSSSSSSASLTSPHRRGRGDSNASSDTVARLEREAAAEEAKTKAEHKGQDRASEIGIKQHISTSMKSLYRLARATGIERAEFERLVRTELDVLGLMEADD